MATVVRVRGSAYRREGARMLVRDDGALTCMLSGGCLEPDVVEVARSVLATGRPALRHYDLAEDVVWGLGLGCGGAVDVLIEPIDEGPTGQRWLSLLETGSLGVEATRLDGHPGRLVVDGSGAVVGSCGGAALDAEVRRVAASLAGAAHPRAETRTLDTAEGPLDVFFDVSAPPPDLVLFGAGHDAIPLAALARSYGWRVTVVDVRAAFTTPERFPDARLVLAHPTQFPSHVPLDARTDVVIMNHHLERDAATLAYVLSTPASWIGVLGPRSRYEKLLAMVAEDAGPPAAEALGRVRNPIGLDIGAESADEVALSVVAALMAERRGFQGGPLDGVSGRIHDPRR
jgi:xanthine/CO dehydrogenase XdhC/CoxF family maturation factor